MSPENTNKAKLYAQIDELLICARRRVSETMAVTYYEIERIIVEYKQGVAKRAVHGRGLLKILRPDLRLSWSHYRNENNEKIFASQYQTVLPSKEVMKQLLEPTTP